MSTVYVVVKETPYEPSEVIGVCATRQLADLLASHPYDPATVMEFGLIEPNGRDAASHRANREQVGQ